VGFTPDALTFATGLAGGLPIGAVVASPRLTDSLVLGDLGSTFGGGPVPCAAALAIIAVIEREGLIANAVAVGEHLAQGARSLGVRKVSGRGLLLGLHLGRPAWRCSRRCSRAACSPAPPRPRVLRLLPPLSSPLRPICCSPASRRTLT
jgi:acetylornithine/succinyldiaminopimelate/putrescine aminotransferase